MYDAVEILDSYPWPSPDGVRYRRILPGFWAGNFFAGGISDQKQAKILEIADYFLSPEGQEAWLYGIEGQTYKKEGDQVIDLRQEVDGELPSLDSIYPSVSYFSRMASWGTETFDWNHPILEQRYNKDLMNMANTFMNRVLETASPIDVNFALSFIVTPQTGKIEPPEPTKIIFAEDPQQEWDKEIARAKSAGLDKWVAEVNKIARDMGY